VILLVRHLAEDAALAFGDVQETLRSRDGGGSTLDEPGLPRESLGEQRKDGVPIAIVPPPPRLLPLRDPLVVVVVVVIVRVLVLIFFIYFYIFLFVCLFVLNVEMST